MFLPPEKGEIMKICNLSGHAIIQEGIEIIAEISIPNVDLCNPQEIQELARNLAFEASPAVFAGIPIALPGMSILAAHVLAEIHGRCGFWPKVAWAARIDGKFRWEEKFERDLHELRTEARIRRGEIPADRE